MNKIAFAILLMSNGFTFACCHTDAVKEFISCRIDSIVEKNELKIMSKEELVKVQTYFEILDFIAAID